MLFRRHRLSSVVGAAHRCAYAGLLLLGLAVTGVAVIIFGAVAGTLAAVIAGVCTLALFATAWLILPLGMRRV